MLSSNAQDIHFSQFYNHPLYLNPALTGVFSGDQRFTGIYRNQWADVPVPYLTFSAAYDEKWYVPGLKNGLLGWGLSFVRDQAGDGDLSWSFLQATIAYAQQLGDELYLSGGFLLAGGQRAFDPDQLFFGDQFNGDIFDPGLPTLDGFDRTAAGFMNLGGGVNLYYQSQRKRSLAYAGTAFANLNRPNLSFSDREEVELSVRGNVYAFGLVQVSEYWDIGFRGLWHFQGSYKEAVFGAVAKLHLNQDEGEELALQLGLGHRLDDAIISEFAVFYKNWRVTMSYDLNTSPFRVATNRRGGPELSLQHIITKVKPPDEFKSCPIF